MFYHDKAILSAFRESDLQTWKYSREIWSDSLSIATEHLSLNAGITLIVNYKILNFDAMYHSVLIIVINITSHSQHDFAMIMLIYHIIYGNVFRLIRSSLGQPLI
jgi:hypothetical protein